MPLRKLFRQIARLSAFARRNANGCGVDGATELQGYQRTPIPWPKCGITGCRPFRYLKSRWIWRLYAIFEWITSGLEELAITLEDEENDPLA